MIFEEMHTIMKRHYQTSNINHTSSSRHARSTIHSQDSKMASHDRPSTVVERLTRPVPSNEVAITERRVVPPIRHEPVHVVDEHALRVVPAVRRREMHPVRLTPRHTRVERDTGLAALRGVVAALHVEGGGVEGSELEVDVREEVEGRGEAGGVAVDESEVRLVGVGAEPVVVELGGVSHAGVGVVLHAGELSEGVETDGRFDGEVGLVG